MAMQLELFDSEGRPAFPCRVALVPIVTATRLPGGGLHLQPGQAQGRVDVRTACQYLGGMSRSRLYELLEAGEIQGWQPNKPPETVGRSNHKWWVDLASLADYNARLRPRQGL